MSRTHYHCPVCGEPTMSGMNCCEHEQPPHSDLESIILHQQIENLENELATLELENQVLRERNDKLRAENEKLWNRISFYSEGNNH